MIVLDASVVVDLLTKPAAETSELRARIRAAGIVYAPHLMDAEVTGATLRTRDAGLARATGHRARVEVV